MTGVFRVSRWRPVDGNHGQVADSHFCRLENGAAVRSFGLAVPIELVRHPQASLDVQVGSSRGELRIQRCNLPLQFIELFNVFGLILVRQAERRSASILWRRVQVP